MAPGISRGRPRASPCPEAPPLRESGVLEQNRPNPSNPAPLIGFYLKQSGPVKLQVFHLEEALSAVAKRAICTQGVLASKKEDLRS